MRDSGRYDAHPKCAINSQNDIAPKPDVSVDGGFRGILESGPVSKDGMRSLDAAVEAACYIGFDWHSAPGGWLEELAEKVVHQPERFMV